MMKIQIVHNEKIRLIGRTSVSDLSNVATVIPNTANGITSSVWNVKIQELGNKTTSGIVTIVIPKDSRLSFTFDSDATMIGQFAVDNSLWDYDESNTSFHIWTSSEPISKLGSSGFGFNAEYDPQGTSGIVSYSMTIISGSGGETDATNNIDSETILYYSN